jgi:3-oxoacyl-[acyl-carrier protein] reductase
MKSAVITGAGSGIGLATARRFATEGYAVAAVDLDFPAPVRDLLESSGGRCFECDVASIESARKVVEAASRENGGIGALVTCAGISRDAPLSSLTEEDWDRVIDVDLKGTFNYVAACAPVFQQQRHGTIVAVASTLALRARRSVSNYVAAKAGVVGLVRAFACDLRPFGITVNAVAPGLVETRLAERIPAEVRARLQEETCLGRFATPEDVANVIYFLSSGRARCLSGQIVRVDGGQLA